MVTFFFSTWQKWVASDSYLAHDYGWMYSRTEKNQCQVYGLPGIGEIIQSGYSMHL